MKAKILKLVLMVIYLTAEARANCVSELKLTVETGDVQYAEFTANNHIMVLKCLDQELKAKIPPPAKRASTYTKEFSIGEDFGYTGCMQRSDIVQVRIDAGGNDGWYMTSAITTITDDSGASAELTNNPAGLNIWVDGNQAETYSYDAKSIVLSLPDCMATVIVTATTGDVSWADSSSPHKFVLQLENQVLQAALTGSKPRKSVYTKEISMADFQAGIVCVQKGGVKQARIEQGGNDGWYIADIKTEFKIGGGNNLAELTYNNPFNRWVDGNDVDDYTYNAKKLILKLA